MQHNGTVHDPKQSVVVGKQMDPPIIVSDSSEPNWRTFSAAKEAALEALSSCPIDVIRQFINQSWRFMSAYDWTGLTGKAAAWAVKKQQSHCSVPEHAHIAIEALLN